MAERKIILSIRGRLPEIISYISLLYFVEIIALMLIMVIIFGKTASLAAGFSLSLLLAIQIISLNRRNEFTIKIQIAIMDLHFAFSAVFIINLLTGKIDLYPQDIPITAVRIFLGTVELPLLYLLTGERKNTE